MGFSHMTKIKIINEINNLAINRLTMTRKFQLLTWKKERLERVLKAIRQERKKIWLR